MHQDINAMLFLTVTPGTGSKVTVVFSCLHYVFHQKYVQNKKHSNVNVKKSVFFELRWLFFLGKFVGGCCAKRVRTS